MYIEIFICHFYYWLPTCTCLNSQNVKLPSPDDNSTWWVSSTFRVLIPHFFGTFIMTCRLWRKEIIPVYDYTAFMKFMDLDVRCSRKAVKPNHSLPNYSEIDVHPRTANENQHCYRISTSVWNVPLLTFNFWFMIISQLCYRTQMRELTFFRLSSK